MSSEKLRGRRVFARTILNNLVWLIFVLCMGGFSSTIKGFFTFANYVNIVYHSVFIGTLAVAEAYILISGNIDLSVESTAAASAILSVWLSASSPYASGLHLNTWLSFALVMALGCIVGLINGFFVLKLKIESFLITLSTYIIIRAMAVWITGGFGMNDLPAAFRFIDTTKLFMIPLMVYIMILLYLFFEFLLRSTRFGRHVYIIGGNVGAAYNFGIHVDWVLLRVFILSGVISAFTGWMMAARTNGATAGMGVGYLFEVLAAVVIGGVSLSGGVGSLVGVFAGSLILSSIHSALNITAVSPFVTGVIRGLLILVAVSLDAVKRMYKK